MHGTDAHFGATWDAPQQHTWDVGNVAKCHGKNPTFLAKYPIVINLHMSDKFRIFVTEKEIVIRIFTYKTPRRWAKRQSIMRKMRFEENTIRDLGTLNRGQSILLNLYIKGYMHATLAVYNDSIEIVVYGEDINDLTMAEIIIRDHWADSDTLTYDELENEDGPFAYYKWHGHLIETEYK